MDGIEELVKRFRNAGLKITPQRLCIFEILQGNRTHPSAEDIYRKVLALYPSLSFTTVYKTLQILRDMGEILEVTIDPERAHYDPSVEAHSHVFCYRCRAIWDVEAPSPPPSPLPSIPSFDIQEVQTHFLGICASCREKGSKG